MRRLLLTAVLLVAAAFPSLSQQVDFHTQVVPVLMNHCYECHGGNEAKGGFSMNTLALWKDKKAAKPGDAAGSLVIELILEQDPEFAMPPEGKARLTQGEIDLLKKWIDQGMDWEDGFTFAKSQYEVPLKPRRPELPAAVDGRENPIDRIIDAYMAEHGLAPQPALDDAAFYRRLSLDLHGLLPDPEDLARFVADTNPNKHTALVDQLLDNDRDYARHWLTFWNDLLRNDYKGTGYITGGRRSISNWLYRSLLENKPYDTMTQQLLAPTGESDGFIKGIKWRGDVNSSQTTEIQFAQNVGQAFLGINIKCASCHDSFIDRWTLDEAYSLAAIYSEQPLEINRCDKPTGKQAKAAWLFPELGEIDANAPRDERLKQLAALMTSPDNGRLTRTITNRLWHRMMGRGVVHPVDAMQTEPWSADLLDQLAVHLSDQRYDLKATLRLIATSHAYRSKTLALGNEPANEDYQFAGPHIKRMTAEQLVDTIRQVTETQTTAVPRNFPAAEIEKKAGAQGEPFTSRAAMQPSDFLQRALGRPNREQVVTSRPQQLTPLQALDLANGQALNKIIQAGAAKLLASHGDKTPNDMITMVFYRGLSREPSDQERVICREMIGPALEREGLEDLLWSVFMLPEFQHIR